MSADSQSDKKDGGLKIRSHFLVDGEDPFSRFRFVRRDATIRDAGGKVIFHQPGVEVPDTWSQTATDILAQKYFRRTGVPQADGSSGAEYSVRQVVARMASCWADTGSRLGYFASKKDADVFRREMIFLMLSQRAAPNSPQWFNTGLYHSYGIKGPSQGHYYYDENSQTVCRSESAYERPQPHACFILSVKDDLVNEGGIMDLWVKEARIFKYGSGSGTNFSAIRAKGEELSGGGESSGLMSFLRVGDSAAAAVKSGGTTRRAAKMVCLDVDHPEVIEFIHWKAGEERKAKALMEAGYSGGFEGEAYSSVSGQHSNNSLRMSDAFFDALNHKSAWPLIARTDGRVMQEVQAEKIWNELAKAAWLCADPGLQFDSTINEWNTCPEDGRIKASNPCSEYMFLDNTACNLASVNLLRFYDAEKHLFEVEGFAHTCRLLTIMLDISVSMAQYPSPEVAANSWRYRTLGLGFANLGALLMQAGIPYDSDAGRLVGAGVAALMSACAWETSAELAGALGSFEAFERNRNHVFRVLKNHRVMMPDITDGPIGLSVQPVKLQDKDHFGLCEAASVRYDHALRTGYNSGFRNAQLTVIAPTGTIGFVMDCDTTGIEPDFALVKYKKLSGGGYLRIVNQSVEPALAKLGYAKQEAADLLRWLRGSGSLHGLPYLNSSQLLAAGLSDSDIDKLERLAPTVMHIRELLLPSVLGEEAMHRIGLDAEQYQDLNFDLPASLGFTPEQIEEANVALCGRQNLEGAPILKKEHLPVFDCAVSGMSGRTLSAEGHLKMMAAVQPFICGAISKTVNLPNQADVKQVQAVFYKAWQLGLKAISVYRDGSKGTQPLSLPDNAFSWGMQQSEASGSTGMQWVLKLDGREFRMNYQPASAENTTELHLDLPGAEVSFRALLACFAKAVSMGLQAGVPLERFVDTFVHTRFEPAGFTSHPNIRLTSSVLDLCFRLLGFHVLNRTEFANVVGEGEALKPEIHAPISESFSVAMPRLYNFASPAPVCPFCGHRTIPSGTCYKCSNCGTSLGCT